MMATRGEASSAANAVGASEATPAKKTKGARRAVDGLTSDEAGGLSAGLRRPAPASHGLFRPFGGRYGAARHANGGQPLTLSRHEGYDHGYYFIETFIEAHIAHHARALT